MWVCLKTGGPAKWWRTNAGLPLPRTPAEHQQSHSAAARFPDRCLGKANCRTTNSPDLTCVCVCLFFMPRRELIVFHAYSRAQGALICPFLTPNSFPAVTSGDPTCSAAAATLGDPDADLLAAAEEHGLLLARSTPPAIQPTSQPASRPTDRPTDQPASQPANQPTNHQPASQSSQTRNHQLTSQGSNGRCQTIRQKGTSTTESSREFANMAKADLCLGEGNTKSGRFLFGFPQLAPRVPSESFLSTI